MKKVSPVRDHFDEIAPQYDSFKRRNWYYYGSLKRLLREMVEPQKRVLEIGCGTGEILASVEPERGIGIDISDTMVQLAKKKYLHEPRLMFVAGTVDAVSEEYSAFDYILLVDVVEHLESLPMTVKRLRKISRPFTKILLSMANPHWEPLLMILEKLKMKMPEGPHRRISARELIAEFEKNGLTLRAKKKYLQIPFYLPFFSDPMNQFLARLPLVRELGLIELMVFQIEG